MGKLHTEIDNTLRSWILERDGSYRAAGGWIRNRLLGPGPSCAFSSTQRLSGPSPVAFNLPRCSILGGYRPNDVS